MTIAVIAAMREELRPLARRLGAGRPPAAGKWIDCRLRGGRILVATTGEGAHHAGRTLRSLAAEHRVDVVLAVGVGGGLTAGLEACALVVAERVVDSATGGGHVPPPSEWLERGFRAGPLQAGVVVSSPTIVVRATDKEALARHAGGAAAVVDLESASWAEVCVAEGLPFVIAKCVCDTAAEDLPLDFEALRDGDGAVDRRKVVERAITKPRSWSALHRLGRRVEASGERLADWVLEVAGP